MFDLSQRINASLQHK